MLKGSYKVDLDAFLSECELNYLRLVKLLPKENSNEACYLVIWPSQLTAKIVVKIVQRCKFTTMLTLTQQSSIEWLNYSLELRLYHDVQISDVTGFQRHRNIWPVYKYPNTKMYQQDEKLQQQKFLSQCLSYCLEHGHSDKRLAYLNER